MINAATNKRIWLSSNHLQLSLFVPLPLPAPGSTPAICNSETQGEACNLRLITPTKKNYNCFLAPWVFKLPGHFMMKCLASSKAYTLQTYTLYNVDKLTILKGLKLARVVSVTIISSHSSRNTPLRANTLNTY